MEQIFLLLHRTLRDEFVGSDDVGLADALGAVAGWPAGGRTGVARSEIGGAGQARRE